MKGFFDSKDWAIAVSLANLWFIILWKRLIYSLNERYFDFEPHSLFEYLAVFIDVLLLTFIFLIIINFAKSCSNTWLRRLFQIIFLALGFSAFGALSSEIIKWFSPATINFVNFPLPAIVLSVCVLCAVRQKLRISAIVENLRLGALFLLPFSLLIFIQILWTGFAADPKLIMPQSIESDYSENRNPNFSKKVVWIIFDEAGYAALTTAKRNNINLPDFERLMNQSFNAQNALPPADNTIKSIPSLLTGKSISSIVHSAPNDLMLNPADGSDSFTLRESSNIFKEVRNLGGDTGIVGFYHPYSRVFQGQTAFAFWRPLQSPKCSDLACLTVYSINNFIDSLLNIPFIARFFPALWTFNVTSSNDDHKWNIERNNFSNEKANELIQNPNLNLLFFHFGIPHAPYLARTDLKGNETYFNSLEVANDTLKRLRETLEKSGQWDDTVVIVSSDHWWRYKEPKDFNFLPEEERTKALKDTRIPFIVKFANQKTRLDYTRSFNTVITKELVLAVFRDEIKKPEELVSWLDNLHETKPDLIKRRPILEGFWRERWEP